MRTNDRKKRDRVECIKKFFRFLRISKHDIVEFAREQVEKKLFSMSRICKLCGISKNTFYKHKHLDDLFKEKYNYLKSKIQKIIKNNSAYGVNRIKAALLEDCQKHIGRDALSRLLKLWGLNLKRNIKKNRVSIIKKILLALSDKVNILIRSKITKPFQAITSDITEVWYDGGNKKAYLAVHKDVYGQMVYGWEINKRMKTELVLKSFEKAKKKIKKLIKKLPDNLICHSDQGSQYTSHEYTNTVLGSKIILSYSTPGTPTENPGQESFFGRFKDECQKEINEIQNFKELKKFIRKRMNYYNNRRLHNSLNNQAPKKFTKLFIKNSLKDCLN
ncbi:MAG: IS3 family transposase [Nanoarchaeota archaeon]|nr:IS3 family transposase [Nanoarchaeota archaeon]